MKTIGKQLRYVKKVQISEFDKDNIEPICWLNVFADTQNNLFGFKEAQDGLDTARHGQAVSNEFIQKVNPDYLFIIDRSAVVNKSATNKEAIENVLIKETTAFKNNKIIYLDPEAWYLSGEGATSFGIMVNEVKDNI